MKTALLGMMLATVGLVPPGVPAVTVVGGAGPVSITIEQPAPPGRPFRYLLTNRGTKPVAGVVVALTFYDAQGHAEAGPAQITAIALLPEDAPLAPAAVKNVAIAQSYTVGRGAAKAFPVRTELRLDYVLFKDGSHWGPDRTHQGAALPAMRLGAELERDQLRELLRRQGATALLARLGIR